MCSSNVLSLPPLKLSAVPSGLRSNVEHQTVCMASCMDRPCITSAFKSYSNRSMVLLTMATALLNLSFKC